MNFKTLAILLAPAAALAASPAAAASFTNGSFETSTCGASGGGFATVSVGNGCISGWTVESGSVDYINGYWLAQSGLRSIDLAGNSPGTISQVFDTVVGQLYSVNYFLSGNPDGGSESKFGVVSAVNGSIINSATFEGIQGSSRTDMNYLPWNFSFTATGTTTKLSFASRSDAGAFGAVLDSVSVAAVPEPGTWAMMLLGLGFIGGSMRLAKRKQKQKLTVSYA